MAGQSREVGAVDKDLAVWERRLQIVEKAARIQAEDFELLYGKNSQKIHTLKEDVKGLQEKIKFIKALEQQKVLQPDVSEIKSRRINAANIQNVIECQKQKYFELTKEIDLLQHNCIIKRKHLTQKKKQCKQLKKICRSTAKVFRHTTRNKKKIADLEIKCAAAKMKKNEALYISKKYEEIISILNEDAKYYEEQLNKMKKEMKEQGINIKCCKQDKELAMLTKSMQQQQLNMIQKEFTQATRREQRKLVKHKKKLSKIESKERKYQEAKKKLSDIHNKTKVELDAEEAKELRTYMQLFQKISEATGISSITELEDRIKSQNATHSKMRNLCENAELELKKLKESEKELKAMLEKQAMTQKAIVDGTLLSKLMEMEEDVIERERKNSLKESELNKFSLIIEESRMSLERIMVLLCNALGQNSLHNIGEFTVKKIMQMCENNVEALLQNLDKVKISTVRKLHPSAVQSKPKTAINPEIKKKQEAPAIETSSEDDENNRITIKQRSQKFVEAHTRHKSNRRQILRL